MVSDAQKKATKTYFAKNDLVEIKVRLSKETREKIYNQISSLGYSSNNTFILEAIQEKLERELSKE